MGRLVVGEHAAATCAVWLPIMCPPSRHAIMAAIKARRLEQADHRSISWLAPHSMAQAAVCSSGGRTAGGEETAAGRCEDGSTRRGRARHPVSSAASAAAGRRGSRMEAQRTRGRAAHSGAGGLRRLRVAGTAMNSGNFKLGAPSLKITAVGIQHASARRAPLRAIYKT